MRASEKKSVKIVVYFGTLNFPPEGREKNLRLSSNQNKNTAQTVPYNNVAPDTTTSVL